MNRTEKKTPALRFPEFEGEWEEKKLGEIAKYYDGTHQTPNYVEQGIPFYSVEHLTANDFSKTKFITREVFEKENKRVKLEKGDILMTRIGDIGTARYIDWEVQASFYVSLALIKHDNAVFNSKYLSHFISTQYFQHELWKKTIHVAFPRKINLGEIGECHVILPSFSEQQKIADFLSAVDKRLQLLKDKKTKLEEYKRGVMQRIFSQELRFTRPDGTAYPDWEEKRLGEVVEVIMGQSPDSAYYNEDGIGEVLIQGNADIKNRKTIKRLWTTQITKRCLFNDLILTVRAPVGSIAKAAFSACVGRGVCAIRPKSKASVNFLFQTLINLEPSWRRLEQGSTFTSVNSTDINNFKIEFPHIEEQHQIADFLSSIDDKIALLTKQIQSTEQYKKGLLQQLFV